MSRPLPWSWVAPLLSTDVSTPTSPGSRCSLKLLDTAFLSANNKVGSWLYTSKKGEVTKKKKDNLSLPKVLERFTRFALANPTNAAGPQHVCVVHSRSGDRRLLSHGDFQKCVEEGSGLEDAEALQCYLRPRGGQEEVHRCKYSPSGSSFSVSSGSDSRPISDSPVTSEITSLADLIASHISLAATKMSNKASPGPDLTCAAFTADFVLDDNGQLWLCSVSDCVVGPAPSPPSPLPDTMPPISTSMGGSPPRKDNALPSLDDGAPASKHAPTSLFFKEGHGSNAVWRCARGIEEVRPPQPNWCTLRSLTLISSTRSCRAWLAGPSRIRTAPARWTCLR